MSRLTTAQVIGGRVLNPVLVCVVVVECCVAHGVFFFGLFVAAGAQATPTISAQVNHRIAP